MPETIEAQAGVRLWVCPGWFMSYLELPSRAALWYLGRARTRRVTFLGPMRSPQERLRFRSLN
jgi:hypothetical protein